MAEMLYSTSMNSCIYIELASDNVNTCISREHKHLRGRGLESRGHNLILKSRLFDAHCTCSILHVAIHAWLWGCRCIIHQRSKIKYKHIPIFSSIYIFPPIFFTSLVYIFFLFLSSCISQNGSTFILFHSSNKGGDLAK